MSSIKLATTTSGTLATSFQDGSTIDGQILQVGDRILIKNQVDGVENGVYDVKSSGAPDRAGGYAIGVDLSHMVFFILDGTQNAGSAWMVTNSNGNGVVDTDAISFVRLLAPNPLILNDVQTVTNKTIDSDNNTITNIDNADIKASAGIDATKIANGSVSSTEFQYINTLSSNAQTQLNSRVVGPGSATDNAVVRFDGTGGKTAQDSGIIIDDSNNITGVVNLTNSGYIQLSDISAPSNPSNGEGRIYKKTGDDGLFWKPDSGGSEVDMTAFGYGDVTAASNVTSESVVVGDDGAKGVKESAWHIDSNGMMYSDANVTGFMLDVHNTNPSGGDGFHIHAGEVAGDLSFKVTDRDGTFNIMELEANNGFIVTHKTYAQTLADNGVVYGFDNQHSGVAKDFNTQHGIYRMGGVDIADVAQTLTNKTWGDNLNMNSNKIINLAEPTADTDAATKSYVDGVAAGLDIKASVVASSTQDLNSNTSISGVISYNATGGASGRGQITATLQASDTFTVDGVSFGAAEDGSRVLLKDQSTGGQNGIWITTVSGTSLTLDRATDYNQDDEVTSGAFCFVEQGATNADSGWVLTTDDPITIGGSSGTALSYSQFSGAGNITAGTGMAKSGNTLNVGGSTTVIANADNLEVNSSSTANQVLLSSGSVGTASTFGALPLGNSNAVSGTLSIARGGTNATSFSAGSRVVATNSGNTALQTTSLDPSLIITTTGTQTLTNKTINASSNTLSNIANTHISSSAAIDATKIGNGSVTSTEFSYINSLSSNVQTQINNHTGASSAHGVSGSLVGTTDTQTLTNKTINASNNTLSNIADAHISASAAIDATKIANGSISNTEFQYLNGVTSNIQTQIDAVSGGTPWSTSGSDIYYSGGNVAIGHTDPGTARLLIRSPGFGVNEPWLKMEGDGSSDGGFIMYYYSPGTNGPAIKLSDYDDPPRIEFQQTGSGSESSPQYYTWFGMANGSNTDMRLDGGNFGIGKDPSNALDVSGNMRSSGYIELSDMSAPSNPSNGEGRLYKKTGNDGLFWKPDSAGPEVDLTDGGGGGSSTLADLTDTNITAAAKGDLLVHNGSNWIDLTAGSNSQVLTVNSSQPAGFEWFSLPEKMAISVYDAVGAQVVNGGPTINLDSVSHNSGHFTLSNDEITVNESGLFMIAFQVSTEISSGSARSDTFCWLERDTGAGFSYVDGTRAYMYNRTSGNSAATGSRTIILDLTTGDKFRIRSDIYTGSDTMVTIAEGSGITINGIGGSGVPGQDGTPGATGPTGAPGPAGSGVNINVYDNGAPVTGSPFEVLNFIGGVTVTQNGGNPDQVDLNVGQSWWGALASDPVGSPSAGDKYFNTQLNEEMFYDASRSKWLSVAMRFEGSGLNGTTSRGQFYKRFNGMSLSATEGPYVQKGTIVEIGFGTATAVSHTYEILVGGIITAELSSGGAAEAFTNTVDADFDGGKMSSRNKSGSSTTNNFQGRIGYRLRSP